MNRGRGQWVISGGIGSGKTAVRHLFSELGFATIDADAVGHDVLASDRPAYREVAERWPNVVVSGQIDRGALASIVFADENELRELERITHPRIFGIIRQHVEQIDGPVLAEIPLLRHSLGEQWRRIVVDSDEAIRLERLIAKGIEPPDARNRMAVQPSRESWLSQADVVIPNHDTLDELAAAVSQLASGLMSYRNWN